MACRAGACTVAVEDTLRRRYLQTRYDATALTSRSPLRGSHRVYNRPMLQVNRTFIRAWAHEYDRQRRRTLRGRREEAEERALKGWIRGQPSIKPLDKAHFLRLANWKTRRGSPAYARNASSLIREATRLA